MPPESAEVPAPKLGLLAGSGDVPRQLIAACRRAGRPVFVVAFPGQTDPDLVADVPHAWLPLGAASRILRRLKRAGVGEVVMAGAMARPSLTALRPDWRASRIMARAMRRGGGDDALLRAIAGELEHAGLRVVAAYSVLSELLARSGYYGPHRPSEADWSDIQRGVAVARALGQVDAGQAAVVQGGLVLGVEAIEGTAALIDRCAALKRPGPPHGVLVKTCKPDQDTRLDLPTIGTATVHQLADAGLAGVAIESGAALVVEPDAVAKAAAEAGLFVAALASDGTAAPPEVTR